MPREHRTALLALVFANILWGSAFVAAKYLLRELSPPLVAFVRVAPAVPVMFGFMLWRRLPLGLTLRDAAAYALLGLLGFAGAKYLQYSGLAKSTAVDGALLVSFEAILTMLAAVVLLREALTGRKLASAALGVIGVCIISRLKPWEGLAILADQHVVGNAIMVASLACEAGYTVWGARLMRAHDPYRAMTWSVCFGALLLVPALPATAFAELRDATGGMWAAVVFLGVGPTAIAYTIWLMAARWLDASNMAITLYIQPLSGTIVAILLLGERLSWSAALGGVLLLMAVQIAARGQAPRGDAMLGDATVQAP